MTTVEIWVTDSGWYWHAKAGNGEIIAQGEAYSTKWNAKRAARRVFPDAEVRFP